MITKEIPFEIYKGEEVVVKTIIRKGKKIKEKKFLLKLKKEFT